MTDAELRALLLDCLALWGVEGRVEASEHGLQIAADDREVEQEELWNHRWTQIHTDHLCLSVFICGSISLVLYEFTGLAAGFMGQADGIDMHATVD